MPVRPDQIEGFKQGSPVTAEGVVRFGIFSVNEALTGRIGAPKNSQGQIRYGISAVVSQQVALERLGVSVDEIDTSDLVIDVAMDTGRDSQSEYLNGAVAAVAFALGDDLPNVERQLLHERFNFVPETLAEEAA